MLRLKRIFKNYEETGSLNEQVNLYGFIDNHVFLTKSGELGRHPRSAAESIMSASMGLQLTVSRSVSNRHSSCSTKTTASISTSSNETTRLFPTNSTVIPSSTPLSKTASRT